MTHPVQLTALQGERERERERESKSMIGFYAVYIFPGRRGAFISPISHPRVQPQDR